MPPSGSARKARQPRDTGFPEPFASARNTTLPHPSADLSPNAWIGQDDVHADLVMKRRGKSFLHRPKKTKKKVVHGIVPATSSVVSLASSAAASSSSTGVHQAPTATTTHGSRSRSSSIQPRARANSQLSVVETAPSPTVSKSARDSFATTRRDEDETPPTSPDEASTKTSRGLFRKLRRHH